MNNYFENLRDYLAAVGVAQKALDSNAISKSQYEKAETIFAEKYGISLCSIYRDITG